MSKPLEESYTIIEIEPREYVLRGSNPRFHLMKKFNHQWTYPLHIYIGYEFWKIPTSHIRMSSWLKGMFLYILMRLGVCDIPGNVSRLIGAIWGKCIKPWCAHKHHSARSKHGSN